MLTNIEVEKLATLSRIKLSAEEKELLRKDLSSVLSYIDEIQAVTAKSTIAGSPSHRNILRDDSDPHAPGEFSSRLIAAAPASQNNFIKVKKIL